MSILEYEEKDKQKIILMDKLVDMGYEDYVEKLSDQDLFNMVDTFVDIVDVMNNEIEEDEAKFNFLLDYIIVMWAEMIVDLGKDSELL